MRNPLRLAIFITALLAAPCLHAQEAPPADVRTESVDDPAAGHGVMDVVFSWVNFIVLFGGLGYLLRKPAAQFFEERRTAIIGGLERSRAAQHDAAAQMADIEARLAKLAEEVAAIQASAEAASQADHERILRDARVEAERALTQSRAEVERLARGLVREVRAHVGDQVIARTEERLRARIDGRGHERLIRRALEQF